VLKFNWKSLLEKKRAFMRNGSTGKGSVKQVHGSGLAKKKIMNLQAASHSAKTIDFF
jgi:hypothetical protein